MRFDAEVTIDGSLREDSVGLQQSRWRKNSEFVRRNCLEPKASRELAEAVAGIRVECVGEPEKLGQANHHEDVERIVSPVDDVGNERVTKHHKEPC